MSVILIYFGNHEVCGTCKCQNKGADSEGNASFKTPKTPHRYTRYTPYQVRVLDVVGAGAFGWKRVLTATSVHCCYGAVLVYKCYLLQYIK